MIIFHTVVISRLHFSTNSLILVLIRIPSRGQSIRSVRSLDLPLDRAFSSRWPGDIFVSKGSRYTDIQEGARKLTRELAGNVAREVCFVSNEIVSRGRKKEREEERERRETRSFDGAFTSWKFQVLFPSKGEIHCVSIDREDEEFTKASSYFSSRLVQRIIITPSNAS